MYGHQRMAVEGHGTPVGGGDVVDDADEGGLAGAVGAKKSVYLALANVHRHIVEGEVAGVLLDDVVSFE